MMALAVRTDFAVAPAFGAQAQTSGTVEESASAAKVASVADSFGMIGRTAVTVDKESDTL